MIFYPFDVSRYRKDTAHLSLLEHAIYRLLLDSYYEKECPLPADDAFLMRRHSIRTSEEKDAYRAVLDEFFYLDGDSYRNDVCDEVIAQVHEKSAKAKVSAEKRWAKEKAKKMRTHSDGNANGMLLKGKVKSKGKSNTIKSTLPRSEFREELIDSTTGEVTYIGGES